MDGLHFGQQVTELAVANFDATIEIYHSGAVELILAVACPNCLTMLEDAVKVEGLEDDIKVMDISEIFC